MNINPFFRNVVTTHRRNRCDHKIVYLEIILKLSRVAQRVSKAQRVFLATASDYATNYILKSYKELVVLYMAILSKFF